jgi:hypothetical protein
MRLIAHLENEIAKMKKDNHETMKQILEDSEKEIDDCTRIFDANMA